MAQTTLVFPPVNLLHTRTTWTIYTAVSAPSTLSGSDILQAVTGTAGQKLPVASGFTLWLPIAASYPLITTVSDVATLLGGTYPSNIPVYSYISGGVTATTAPGSSLTLTYGTTLYYPVDSSLDSVIHLATLGQAALLKASTSNSTSISSITAPTTPTAASSTPSPSSVSTAPRPPPSVPKSTSLQPSPTGKSPGSPSDVPAKTFDGALIGGVIGAFILGTLISSLFGLWRSRRRPSRRTYANSDSTRSTQEHPFSTDPSHTEKPQVIAGGIGLVGWRKHLPQEKDDGKISNYFREIFDKVQIHMEGFYLSRPNNISNADIERLQKLLPDVIPKELLEADDAVLLLQAIFIRWMIYRVSGRSSVVESLLPSGFTEIAKKNRWHMEQTGKEGSGSTEKERGFPQAFSEWRVLTGFLDSSAPSTDQSTRDQEARVDVAVQNLEEVFSPWRAPGVGGAYRRESLCSILVDITAAGVALFVQPATFVFDWSETSREDGTRMAVIAPALLKTRDGLAESLRTKQVLLAARQARI